MTDDFNFYDLLDVGDDASQDEIKTAFREQVRVYHPDLNDDERAQAQFTAVKKAYDILGDPVERQAYDRLGHEDYVAKRTSGLPSPDLWKHPDKSESKSPGSSTDDTESTTRQSDSRRTDSRSSRSTTRSRTTGTGSRTGDSRSPSSGTTADTRAAESSNGSASSRSQTSSSTGSTSKTGTTGASTSSTGGERATNEASSSAGNQGGNTNGSARTNGGFVGSGRTTADSRPGRVTDNVLVRWWRNQNFAWPLIYAATLIYLAGVAHFVRAHEAPLTSLVNDLQSHGTDLVAIWTTLSTGRSAIPTPLAFVSSVELVSPALEPLEWYGLLGGIVISSLFLVIIGRIRWRTETWGSVSIDETIVVAIALTGVTMAVGGPLLTGTVLMPLLFGVIVHRTHQLPGWSPSYLYVLCVLAPAIGFGVIFAGYSTLPLEIVLFGILPLLGALGLPLRASIRKRFGR